MDTGNDSPNYLFDDSKRPALPYVAGASFEIKRHKPLAPFDSGICYAYPTQFSLMHQLEVVRQIRVRDGAYAQVVQCRIDGIRGPLVAKIFDPLYRWEDVELDEPWSPVGLAESEWSCEAAAYTRIHDRGLDGRHTPRFEGCWSFEIPYELELARNSSAGQTSVVTATTTTAIDDGPHSNDDRGIRQQQLSKRPECRTFKTTRNVRLLLMEYIPGDSILQLLRTGSYQDIPPHIRMDLLGRIAEAQNALWHIRKGQKRRGLDSQKWLVALVDFGRSVVLDLPNATSNLKGRLPPALPLPPNPMTRCRGSWPVYPLCLDPDCDGDAPREDNWVHDDYQSFKARREWMEARWDINGWKAWKGGGGLFRSLLLL
ncbi:hypothetical protein KVR01_009513 [Diaporthe batatas]|uniref:uncharacterized protein n=1 Tax=Diaporthe batatas TaxID=748121 RepID=UPI001D052DF7|nr:uncharacterized protein KVR01_009513 [Diaporthe batatas]KAG8161249.1 hypothetical protein KVR01_009513 [Diaporthe batatas]